MGAVNLNFVEMRFAVLLFVLIMVESNNEMAHDHSMMTIDELISELKQIATKDNHANEIRAILKPRYCRHFIWRHRRACL